MRASASRLHGRSRQRQPRREEKQVLQMLLAVPLQSLRPLFQFLRLRSPARRRSAVAWSVARSSKVIRRAQSGRRLLQFCVELRQRRIFAGQVSENPHRVAQTGENLRREDLFVGQFPQPGAERQQMSREVAAVHAGNIEREQRLERAGVIPIVEMAAMPFEALHRGEGVLRAPDQAGPPTDSRNPGRPGWRAAPDPCWWAKCARRSPGRALPGNCPAAASFPAR